MANPEPNIRAYLTKIYGEKLNEEYKLTGSTVSIGRNPKCQIALACTSVSRKHCVLTYSDEGWKVRDNKSRNGTYVNGRQLKPEEEFLLQYGDILFLGPPSEVPEAFSYKEIIGPYESDEDDIIELPTEPTCDQNSEIPVISLDESAEDHKGQKSSTSGSRRKNQSKVKNKAKVKKEIELVDIPEDCPSVNNDLNSNPCVSTFQDSVSQSVNSAAGSDSGGNSQSLLDDGMSSLFDAFDYPQENWEHDAIEEKRKSVGSSRKRKGPEDSEKDEDLESQLALMSKRLKALDSEKDEDLESQLALMSKRLKALEEKNQELKNNYEKECKKNKVLDEQLADKQKKLEEDLQTYEVKAKNEVKTELLEKLEEDLICNICTELFIVPVVLDCCHTFCEYCINEWRKKKNDCPICRSRIKSITRVRTLEEFIDKTIATLTPQQRVKRGDVMAQRNMAAKSPKQGTPRGRRGGRGRQRNSRPYPIPINSQNDSSIVIVHESRNPRQTRATTTNLPDPDGRLNLPFVPLLRFFFT